MQEVLPNGDVETLGKDGYTVAATSGNTTTGEDFANFVKFSISGTKYTDAKGDDTTTHNADDTPLANITINLYASGDLINPIAHTTTAADGSYSFNNLGPLSGGQSYVVQEVLPNGDVETLGKDGYTVAATSGNTTTGEDFANFVKFSISGTKYTDAKGDDTTTHNADDSPLANITINLYASGDLINPIAHTTTAADGSYSFNNLGPLSGGQSYVVQEVLPNGDVETLGKDGYTVAATSGNTTTGEDFANFVKFSISGTKYTDAKGDDTTTHNADDTPLANITINLYASGDLINPIAHTTTAADGSYSFNNLGPLSGGQSYVVQEVLPNGDVETLGKDGYTVAATSGNTTTGEDFANFVKFSISGTKYTDAKGDDTTTHNADDSPLANITINLYASGDLINPIAHTTTAADGSYSFNDLGPLSGGQSYVVQEVLPNGDVETLGKDGYTVAATSGNTTTGEDFANFVKFSISGTKYTDAKGDDTTTHNADDTPLANITINLYASGDLINPIAHTTTAADGSYSFNDLGPLSGGQSYVVQEVLPNGDVETLGKDGYTVAATSGNTTTGEDFANFVKFSISGTKYTDAKGDDTTTHNADDTPLANITINLYASGDLINPIAHTTTAADGSYSFNNLGPLSGGQSYVVQEVLPNGDVETLGKDGYTVAATSGNTTTGEDFANFVKFSISGTKYTDAKGDDTTTHNADDTPLANITINLYASGDLINPIAHTTTAADGSYSFNDLGPLSGGQSYVVQEVLPNGDVETLGKDGYTVAATSGNTTTGEDFANFVKFSISGTKYTDVKGDDTTTHNVDDTPLANITINLYASGDLINPIAHTTTAADGSYSFNNLGPLSGGQSYVVQEVLPNGDVETLGKDGYTVAATSGNTTTGEDFANFVKFSISGTKYTDVKGDDTTTHNADDTPLAGITINLYASGDLINPIAHTTTAGDGSYSFNDLGPLTGGQSYFVQEVLPNGYVETLGKAGYTVAATSGDTTTGEDFANFLPPAGQGLTPGFWKNHVDILNHELGEFHSGWTANTSFETAFGFQTSNKIPGTPSIADALGANGGGINHLERSSAAAFLSAAVNAVPDGPGGKTALNFSFSAATSSNPAIIGILNQIDANHDHTLQVSEVIAAVRDVLNDTGAPTSNFGLSGQPGIEDIANAFDAMNNQLHPDASVFLV
ncbi:beta strand repeat-containing protein [Mesorhizobium sp. ORM8.1]